MATGRQAGTPCRSALPACLALAWHDLKMTHAEQANTGGQSRSHRSSPPACPLCPVTSADVDPQYRSDADSSVLRGWAAKGPRRLAEEIGQKLAVGRLLAGGWDRCMLGWAAGAGRGIATCLVSSILPLAS